MVTHVWSSPPSPGVPAPGHRLPFFAAPDNTNDPEPPASPLAEDEGSRSLRLHCGRVLIVEDDSDLRETLADILRDEGFLVTTAIDGITALFTLRARPRPDLILLDLHMPGMDGWAFRAEQQKDPELAQIPIILLAARDVDTHAEAMGVRDYLAKPIELLPLLQAVRRYTG